MKPSSPIPQPKLSVADFSAFVPRQSRVAPLLYTLEQAAPDGLPPLGSLLALHVVHDLHDPTSSDTENVARICAALDGAADELQLISQRFKTLLESA